jgi:hypothetical protein
MTHDESPMQSQHDALHVGVLFEWSDAACLTCHPKSDVYTRMEHPQGILRDHSSNQECSSCHAQQKDLAKSTPGGERTKICTPCHAPGGPD